MNSARNSNARGKLSVFLVVLAVILMNDSAAAGKTVYVDDDGPADFNNIQAAIDDANDGDVIIVKPGRYFEAVYFGGKNLTLTSTKPDNSGIEQSTTISGHSSWRPVTFQGSEGALCRLTGFRIMNGRTEESGGAILGNGAYATIENCIITENCADENGGGLAKCHGRISNCVISNNAALDKGGALYNCGGTIINCTIARNESLLLENAAVQNCRGEIKNCIFFLNAHYDLHNSSNPTYSCYKGATGLGNIDADPSFVDGQPLIVTDCHLKSQAGRYDPLTQGWVYDDVTSPCIDAGDPMSPMGHEPFPSGGIINMGAYGGTDEASKSYFGEPPCETIVAGDINSDCEVNYLDFRLMALHWCEDNNP